MLRRLVMAAALVPAAVSVTLATDAAALRTYRLAEELLRGGRTDQAIEAFGRVVDGYPDSSVADDALLQLARQAFAPNAPEDLSAADVAGALEAIPLLERLLREHPSADRAPAAGYLLGLARMVPGSPAHDLDEAFAAFHEVITIHPGSSLGPHARRGCAAVEMAMDRPGRALVHLEHLFLGWPPGALTDRARLDAADAWIRLEAPEQAMPLLLAVRSRGSQAVLREEALDALSRLLRLDVPGLDRGSFFRLDAAYPPSEVDLGPATSIAVDGAGRLHVLTGGGRTWMKIAADGTVAERGEVREARCLFRDSGGMVGWADAAQLHTAAGTVTLGGHKRRLSPLAAVAVAPDGSFVGVDERGREVRRFGPDGSFRDVLATTGRAVDVEVDRRGRIYVLDARQRVVRTFHPDGSPGPGIGPDGLLGPVDLAVDDSYHVFVLDAKAGAVLVFGREANLLARIGPQLPTPGALREARALAVDRSGAVVVLDGKGRRVRRFR